MAAAKKKAAAKKGAAKKAAAKKQERDTRSWAQFLTEDEKVVTQLRKALGTKRDFDSWLSVARAWISTHEPIHNEVQGGIAAVVAAYVAAAKLGLMIDGEECMVMTRGKDPRLIRCEIAALGVIRKAGQAGIRITRGTVRLGDHWDCNEATGDVVHKRGASIGQPEGEPYLWYAIATHTRSGFRQVITMTEEEMASAKKNGGFAWNSDPNPMREKTCVLRLKKELYLGDDIEDLFSQPAATVGTDWAAGLDDDLPEPQHPPTSASDKVAAAAARARQDADAEASQDPDDQGPVAGDCTCPEDYWSTECPIPEHQAAAEAELEDDGGQGPEPEDGPPHPADAPDPI